MVGKKILIDLDETFSISWKFDILGSWQKKTVIKPFKDYLQRFNDDSFFLREN